LKLCCFGKNSEQILKIVDNPVDMSSVRCYISHIKKISVAADFKSTALKTGNGTKFFANCAGTNMHLKKRSLQTVYINEN
jgi:hypothetical protein